jgi:hypothetical protein
MLPRAVAIVLAGVCLSLVIGQGCPPAPPPPPVETNFAGAATCATCHPAVHTTWSATAHAKAFDDLKAAGAATNTACIGCHVVGYGNDGFVSEAATPQLVGVQCENCHGSGKAHAAAPSAANAPQANLTADLCGGCHNGAHHPTFDEWKTSAHTPVNEEIADGMSTGVSGRTTTCGTCHSGDVFYNGEILGEAQTDTTYEGVPVEDLTPITCVMCHDQHATTGNAVDPEDGRDYQLRFPEAVAITASTPTNTIAAVQDKTRFNLCGQCHHSRNTVWTATSRGPHHSLQVNTFIGEMPVPDGTDPLVTSTLSVHRVLAKQCAACHVHAEEGDETTGALTTSGHSFEPKLDLLYQVSPCNTCHLGLPFADDLRSSVQSRLDGIAARLGDISTWGYTSDGGPDDAGQALLSDNIKQIRFLYYWVTNDGSMGVHNPGYVTAILDKAEALLTAEGL